MSKWLFLTLFLHVPFPEPLHLPWLVKPAVNLYSRDCYCFWRGSSVVKNISFQLTLPRKKGGNNFLTSYSQLHIAHMQYTYFSKVPTKLIFPSERKVKWIHTCIIQYTLLGMHTAGKPLIYWFFHAPIYSPPVLMNVHIYISTYRTT